MSLNINLFTTGPERSSSAKVPTSLVWCPNCNGDLSYIAAQRDWQHCPYCQKRVQIRSWPRIRHDASASVALPEQATCFFHPDKTFQACCQRCGRFVCALCDLQLGSEHVCPTCFERGHTNSAQDGAKAEWRHRDVLYDSIALAIGWAWILFWPVVVVAIPVVIFLHVKYRKAPRSYLIPRSGWRFWMAYPGLIWVPLLIASIFLIPRFLNGSH